MKCNEMHCLRLSLILPILLPAVAYLLDLGGINIPVFSGLLILSIIAGGPPYVVFAIVLIMLLRRKDIKAYYKTAKIAPLLFLPFLTLYIMLSGILGRASWKDLLGIFAFSIISLPISYSYVGVVFLAKHFIFNKNGHPTTASTADA